MHTLTDFIVMYGDIIRLQFPVWNVRNIVNVLNNHPGWKPYQPHKSGNNRYGLSVTSLDGGFSGEPDLFSLREYYQKTGKNYVESDFKVRTNIVEFIPELNPLLDFFEPGIGRCHFLRLDKGGYFPPHRDNGAVTRADSLRILVPIFNFGVYDMKWIQEEKCVNFDIGQVYFINTSKLHSLFSFVDNCYMLVLNIIWNQQILLKMARKVDGF